MVTDAERLQFRIHGMDCAEEIAALKGALKDVVKVDELQFDLLEGTMDVPASVPAETVMTRVAGTGMRAEPLAGGSAVVSGSWLERHRRTLLTVISGLGVFTGFAVHLFLAGLEAAIGSEGFGDQHAVHDVPLAAVLAYGVAVAAGLALVLPKAWHSAKNLRPDMNLLMTLAVAGAIGLGEWFEASAVSFLFALSLTLEAWSVGRARRAVEKLLSLAPPRIRIKRGAVTEEVDPATVPVGTTFIVQPGERFGLDGVVVDGASDVDQAPITGESVPREKGPGAEVFAGTIKNRSGHVKAVLMLPRPFNEIFICSAANDFLDLCFGIHLCKFLLDKINRMITRQVFNLFTQSSGRITQMYFKDLPNIHTGWYTKRVKYDVDRCSIFEERHVLARHRAETTHGAAEPVCPNLLREPGW